MEEEPEPEPEGLKCEDSHSSYHFSLKLLENNWSTSLVALAC